MPFFFCLIRCQINLTNGRQIRLLRFRGLFRRLPIQEVSNGFLLRLCRSLYSVVYTRTRRVLRSGLTRLFDIRLRLRAHHEGLLFSHQRANGPTRLQVQVINGVIFHRRILVLRVLRHFLRSSIVGLIVGSRLVTQRVRVSVLYCQRFCVITLRVLRRSVLFSIICSRLRRRIFRLRRLIRQHRTPRNDLRSLL